MPAAAQPKTSPKPLEICGHGLRLVLPQYRPVVTSLGRGCWGALEPWPFWLGSESARALVLCVIPPGFISDLFSVPRLLRPVIPRDQVDNRPAFAHDLLYATCGLRPDAVSAPLFSRGECDAALRLAMQLTGFGAIRQRSIHAGVRIGGWVPWNELMSDGYCAKVPAMGSRMPGADEAMARELAAYRQRKADLKSQMEDGQDGEPEIDANDFNYNQTYEDRAALKALQSPGGGVSPETEGEV